MRVDPIQVERRTSEAAERPSGFPRARPPEMESGHRCPDQLDLHHASAIVMRRPRTTALHGRNMSHQQDDMLLETARIAGPALPATLVL
jgi:hypothetical protein